MLSLVGSGLLSGCFSKKSPLHLVEGYRYPAEGYVLGYYADVPWEPASYDPTGFPIYGYEHGRPVYGYSSSGAAVLRRVDIRSGCTVPDWEPAPWYRETRKYPAGVRRKALPERYPDTHHPDTRPNMHALVHRMPGPVSAGGNAMPRQYHIRSMTAEEEAAWQAHQEELQELMRQLEQQERLQCPRCSNDQPCDNSHRIWAF